MKCLLIYNRREGNKKLMETNFKFYTCIWNSGSFKLSTQFSFLYYLIMKSCYEIVVMSKVLTQDFSCLARRDRVMSLMGVQSCWGSCGKVYEWHIPIIEHRIEHQTFSMKVKVCPDIGGMPCAHHATLCTIGCRGDYLAYNPCLKHSFQALFHNVSTFLNSMLHGLTLHAIRCANEALKNCTQKH